jgi:succinate dehydrogenase / fumarate reductase, iron-sulfur subunit
MMQFQLSIWRQGSPGEPGELVDYQVDDISPDMSFLEMLDGGRTYPIR